MPQLRMARRQSCIDETDPMTIHGEGDGLFQGKTGERAMFSVSGAPNQFGLSYNLDGPGGMKMDVFLEEENGDNISFDDADADKIHGTYVPLIPGEYILSIKWKGNHIRGSPFTSVVTGDWIDPTKDVAKVKVIGTAIEVGKAGELNEFLVDASMMNTLIGGLYVHIVGPKRAAAHLKIHDYKNGTYRVGYKPTSAGDYTLTIKIADCHIPWSPFYVHVVDLHSTLPPQRGETVSTCASGFVSKEINNNNPLKSSGQLIA